MNLRIRNKFH